MYAMLNWPRFASTFWERHEGYNAVYKTPWQGDPRVNIQESGGGKAKTYQVKQVLMAVVRLQGE